MCRNPVEELLVGVRLHYIGCLRRTTPKTLPKQKLILNTNPELNCALVAVLRREPI